MSIRKLFLLDGSGALLTALMLMLVLPKLDLLTGIDPDMITVMVLIAFLLAAMSLTFFFTYNQQSYKVLQVIGISNLLYSGIIVVVLLVHGSSMKPLGMTYFILEGLVVALLGLVDIRKHKKVSDYVG